MSERERESKRVIKPKIINHMGKLSAIGESS